MSECCLSPESQAFSLLSVDVIRTDGGTQTRKSVDAQTVRQYAALMKEEVVFPPVRVWFDGACYWLADGFHRLAAAVLAGFRYVSAEIAEGRLEDAIWDSYSANTRHGLRRTKSEVAEIIRMAVVHPRAESLSNVELARHLGIPEPTLRRWRKRLSSPRDEDGIRVVTRNGQRYTIRTSNIGQRSRRAGNSGKSLEQLKEEIHAMESMASPKTQAVLRVLREWAFGSMAAEDCVNEVEALVGRTAAQRR